MKKIVVIGVIFLFICVGFQPAFAVELKSSADNIEKEEDCDCQTVVSNDDLNKIDRAINRIEGYTKLLSLYTKRNPEIAEWENESICIFLVIILSISYLRQYILLERLIKAQGIKFKILNFFYYRLLRTIDNILILGQKYECEKLYNDTFVPECFYSCLESRK